VSRARPGAVERPLSAARRRVRWREVRGALFVLPWVIGFVVFQLFPFLASLVLSFTEWNFSQAPKVVGLENYRRLLLDDPLLRRSVWNTLYYTAIHVPGGLLIAFCLALLLNQRVRGIAVFRTLFYLPSITTGVATVIIWIFLFQPNGLINKALGLVGVPGPNWLTSPTWAMPALILMSLWTVGTPMILYLAGLQGIPETLYEAAMIDGADWRSKFWHVTVPMMTPQIFMTSVLGIIGSFQVFTGALVMTNGGPGDATTFILLHMYWQGWQYFRMGYASAIAWVLLLIILAFTFAQLRLARHWVYYEYDERGGG
jgi:multiple sugar transport system permease protein